jgi:hypothetical protein
MNKTKILIFMAATFVLTIGFLPPSWSNEIPDNLKPWVIQALKNEMPAGYHVKNSASGSLAANNPAQRLSFGFTRGAIELSSEDQSQWRMQLLRYGFDSRSVNIKPILPKTNGARVDFEHAGMTEWYINSPYGMEQGFTFQSPGAQQSKQLTIDIAIEGEVKQKGNSLEFGAKSGRKILYKGLQAYDATGRRLDSELCLQKKQLSIVVNVKDAVYPVTVDPLFSNETKITAFDGITQDQFGTSVAISDNTAVIGAALSDPHGIDSGAAYVFVRNRTSWSLQQKLTALDGSAGDLFGSRVAISGDTIIIGALFDGDKGTNSGSAYVFVRNGTTWSQQQKLTASDGAAYDYFSQSVAISGETIIIGAVQDSDKGTNSGSAYVFKRSGTTWSQQQKLTASDGAAYEQFGWSAAIIADTAIIGAPGTGNSGLEAGAAYVFVQNGSTWSEQQKLTSSDGAAADYFGVQVGISGDTVVIGADYDDDKGSQSGSAYVFVRSGTTWSQQQKLVPSDGATMDHFGGAVAISNDTIVIGANGNTDNLKFFGSAYVFVRNGTTWSSQQKLTSSDSEYEDMFGLHVAISGDTIVISASLDDDQGTDSGSAYIYQIPMTPDFNGDGYADILWRNSVTGVNVVWNMTGNDILYTELPDAVADIQWKIAGLADFDFDGKPDIVWRNYETGQNYIWFMDGATHASGAYFEAVPDLDWKIVGTADFNGDGKPDIVWRNFSTGINLIWFMDGTTHVGDASFDAVPDLAWKIVGLGDFDKDGSTDVLWRNFSTGQNYVWFMNGATHTAGAYIDAVADLDWNVAALADFNKDGRVDIVWRNGVTGMNVVWYMNGILHTDGEYIPAVADTDWKVATATP